MSEMQTGILLGELIEKFRNRLNDGYKLRLRNYNNMWQLTYKPQEHDTERRLCDVETPVLLIEFIIRNEEEMIKAIWKMEAQCKSSHWERRSNMKNILYWSFY